MSLDFSDFLTALDEDEFEERPVPVEEFVSSSDFLGFPPLSDYQMGIVKVGSQIYKEETLKKLYGDDAGKLMWKNNKNQLIMMLGKGSGKDALSTIICAYIVYQLLCLKDPARYYGKPTGDNIDIVNVAINSKQANNVFFSGLKTRIKNCPWFNGKYNQRATDIEFVKNIKVHSLNSEGESTEGYNIMVAVLDEIDGFDEGKQTETGPKMYKTLRATVSSRFADVGKILALSFPRSPDGFIMSKYNEFVSEKTVTKKSHTFKLNKELPDGTPGNDFTVEWEEDHIISYKFGNVWALRRPTWDVNPTKSIDDFVMDFYADPADSLGRFACQPSEYGDGGFFRDKAKIDASFINPNGISEDGSIVLKPEHDKQYYIHVDLARVQDNCAVSMAHVDSFKRIKIGNTLTEPSPYVVVDVVKYWKPSRDNPIDFSHVREFIISLRRAGFNIMKVTFDRWESVQIMDQLNAISIKSERLSVDRDHYLEMAQALGENRLIGPNVDLLKSELKKLIVMPNGKVDHPSKSSKDLSDAVVGAVYNCITLTPKESHIEVVTYKNLVQEERKSYEENTIAAPKIDMPDDLAYILNNMRIL